MESDDQDIFDDMRDSLAAVARRINKYDRKTSWLQKNIIIIIIITILLIKILIKRTKNRYKV